MYRFVSAAVVAACVAFTSSAVAADKVSDVTKDKLTQTVTLEGKSTGFKASKGEKSPNSFRLKDATGEVRIVIWPDTFGNISGKEALEKEGAQVTVTGEVAEYRGNIELHVKDPANVKLSASTGAASSATTATVTQTGASSAAK